MVRNNPEGAPLTFPRCHRSRNRRTTLPEIPPKINVSCREESDPRRRDQVRCSIYHQDA